MIESNAVTFESIDSLKQEFTDCLVRVRDDIPELARFKNKTGTIKTVNMNGRPLVQFFGTDLSWYDIHRDALIRIETIDRTEDRVDTHRVDTPRGDSEIDHAAAAINEAEGDEVLQVNSDDLSTILESTKPTGFDKFMRVAQFVCVVIPLIWTLYVYSTFTRENQKLTNAALSLATKVSLLDEAIKAAQVERLGEIRFQDQIAVDVAGIEKNRFRVSAHGTFKNISDSPYRISFLLVEIFEGREIITKVPNGKGVGGRKPTSNVYYINYPPNPLKINWDSGQIAWERMGGWIHRGTVNPEVLDRVLRKAWPLRGYEIVRSGGGTALIRPGESVSFDKVYWVETKRRHLAYQVTIFLNDGVNEDGTFNESQIRHSVWTSNLSVIRSAMTK